MTSFIHLHTHSNFSFLDGTIPLKALVEEAKRLQMTALALTDHNGLYGAIEFYQLCREHKIKPIIGAQVGMPEGASLVLLAQDIVGYRNLCEIISVARLRGGHLGFKCEMEDLLAHKDKLIVLSGGKKGLISQLVMTRNFEDAEAHCRWMKERFGENFFLELQRFTSWDDFLNQRLCQIAGKYGVPLVATNDVHLLSPDDLPLRQILHAIDQNTLRERVRTAGHKEQYFKTPREMCRLFANIPQAIQNTNRIAKACHLELTLGKAIFPVVDLPQNETPKSYLHNLCFRGAKKLYKPLQEKVVTRIKYELNVINTLGFTDYFLIVYDIVQFCRRKSIPCVGRGSAADSIVSYLLGITFADPIRFNLYFERFLNPERTDAPDIDLDICWKNRDRVIDYVYQRYGGERTAMICTFSTFQSRASLREVAKVFGLPEEEISDLTREFSYMAKMVTRDQNLKAGPQLEKRRSFDKTFLEIIKISKQLAGFPRHLSIHSGGVIIAPDRLTHYTPLEVARKGLVISQYDMHSIELLGLVKMDLLGVRSLSIITDCMELAKRSLFGESVSQSDLRTYEPDRARGELRIEDKQLRLDADIDWNDFSGPQVPHGHLTEKNRKSENGVLQQRVYRGPEDKDKFAFLKKAERLSTLDMRVIQEDDPDTIAMIKAGQTLGCFQLESPLVRGVLRKMQTDNIDDTVVVVAVIRPGVGDSFMKDEYIMRRGGVRPSRYLHPCLEPVLGETHGLIIYQEQVLLVAQAIAGFSLAQGDTLRRAMTKSRNPDLMNSMRKQFIDGAVKKGLAEAKAKEIWQHLLNFTGFGFNKAHAATYGILAYQTAFLKCYFPVEFMTAVLNNPGGFYSTAVYISECRRIRLKPGQVGIPLLAPDVNCSEMAFSREGEAIRVGLLTVLELSDRTKQRIVAERRKRRFSSLFDFLRRTHAGEKEVRHLIRIGALRSLHPSEPFLLLSARSFFKSGGSEASAEYLTQRLQPPPPPYSKEQRILSELDLLGFGLTGHPLELYDNVVPWENMVRSSELERFKGRRVRFTGWYVTSRLQETVNGSYMKFLSLEDNFGVCETIFFPNVYERYAEVLRGLGPFTVTGKVQSRIKGEANLIAEQVIRWAPPHEVVEQKIRGMQMDAFVKAS